MHRIDLHVTVRLDDTMTLEIEGWEVEGEIVDHGSRPGLYCPGDPVDYELESVAHSTDLHCHGVMTTSALLVWSGVTEDQLDEAVSEALAELTFAVLDDYEDHDSDLPASLC